MKKTPINIKPPKRSSSLVTRITRPIIEQKSQRAVSPASSFSSSILTKGMAERITPPSTSSSSRRSTNHSSKSNRRRTLDFTRRQSITNTTEQHSNKENLSKKSSGDIYQFSPLSSNSKTDILNPSSKHTATKKYYFHSNPTKTNEDLLNNSYGLTLLNHQQQQPPLQSRHSTATVLMMSQVPNNSLKKSLTPRTSVPQKPTLDSLDDLLCDREVESYFYPTSPDSEHIYMNLENLSDSYPSSLSYMHGTLC
jgi:hypothetical protein